MSDEEYIESEENRLAWINYITEREAIKDLQRLRRKTEKKHLKRERTMSNIMAYRRKLWEIRNVDRKQRLKRKKERRYYHRKRKQFLKERKSAGDRKGFYMVMTMRNGERYEKVSTNRWMSGAYEVFNKMSNDYRDNVVGDVIYTKRIDRVTKHHIIDGPFYYEILLLKRRDKDVDEEFSYIRNEDGKSVKHVVADNSDYIILEKAPWGMPQKYYVYGYDRWKDKKTGKWIIDNLVTNDLSKTTMRRIMLYGSKIIIQNGVNFDLILCYDKRECEMLYNAMEKYITSHRIEYVFFTGPVLGKMVTIWHERIQKKTGWKHTKCQAV